MPEILHDFDEVVSRPIVLSGTDQIRRGRVRLAPDYVPSPFGGVVQLTGSASAEGVTVEGHDYATWAASRQYPIHGFSMANTTRGGLYGCHARRFSGTGFLIQGAKRGEVISCGFDECNQGLNLHYPQGTDTADLLVEWFTWGRTWDPTDYNNKGAPSRTHPGQRVGGNHLAGIGGRRVKFSHVSGSGEGGGAKFNLFAGISLDHFDVPHLWIGGTGVAPPGYTGTRAAHGYTLTDSTLGGGYIYTPQALYGSGKMDYDPLEIERVTFLAPRTRRVIRAGVASELRRFECLHVREGFRVNVGADVQVVDVYEPEPAPLVVVATDLGGQVIGADRIQIVSVPLQMAG